MYSDILMFPGNAKDFPRKFTVFHSIHVFYYVKISMSHLFPNLLGPYQNGLSTSADFVSWDITSKDPASHGPWAMVWGQAVSLLNMYKLFSLVLLPNNTE